MRAALACKDALLPSSRGGGTAGPTQFLFDISRASVSSLLWWSLCFVFWCSPLAVALSSGLLAVLGGKFPNARPFSDVEYGHGIAAAEKEIDLRRIRSGSGGNRRRRRGYRRRRRRPSPFPAPRTAPWRLRRWTVAPTNPATGDLSRCFLHRRRSEDDNGEEPDDEWVPADDYASGDSSTHRFDAAAGRSSLPGGNKITQFNGTRKQPALHHLVPIWGSRILSSRPEEFCNSRPRPSRMHNHSRCAGTCALLPSSVVYAALTTSNACDWTEELHNLLLGTKMHRLDGQLSARQLSKEVSYTGPALYILFLNLAIRYKVMQFRSTEQSQQRFIDSASEPI